MRRDTRQRKHAMAGLRAMAGEERMLGTMVRVINSGKQALDAVMLEMGRMVAESVMLIEREEVTGPDYYPTDPALQKWAHEDGSIFMGDQKVKVTRPRLRHVEQGEVTLQSYARMRAPGAFSEELLEKILRGVSAQQYADTVLHAAGAFGVSPSTVSRKLVELTATKLKEFQQRSLADCAPFAVFLDTIHRGGEAFLVALGVDRSGEKIALGFWQGSSENHEICEALFGDLERRGLALSKRILFVTDGGSGLLKALRARFGKKLVHQRCAIHKSRNLQRHLPKQDRKAAHQQLKTALEQTSYADARQMLRELEAWLRSKNESAADSLLEAFEELLTLHRLKVPALLRKTLMSTNPIESMFSLVRHSERNIKRTRGSLMLQRWLGTVLLSCESRFKRVKGYAEIAQVITTIEAVHAEPQLVQTKKAA
ncbi:MAG: IS256 family transposase [Nitrospira sp.]|nr:IS256 family transposase [Nitrospira sp.]MDF0651197.1 IS256 family transposase [Nitrospira sp.]MDF0651412.1 IS256 family transposase [Nitrospira sp.]MDF0651549.1 IS256 family transposase [Nitrospira sp.]MDF0652473.1 IS256 family transposase [Nitrospira sp.]